jgi:hypothetical protein
MGSCRLGPQDINSGHPRISCQTPVQTTSTPAHPHLHLHCCPHSTSHFTLHTTLYAPRSTFHAPPSTLHLPRSTFHTPRTTLRLPPPSIVHLYTSSQVWVCRQPPRLQEATGPSPRATGHDHNKRKRSAMCCDDFPRDRLEHEFGPRGFPTVVQRSVHQHSRRRGHPRALMTYACCCDVVMTRSSAVV